MSSRASVEAEQLESLDASHEYALSRSQHSEQRQGAHSSGINGSGGYLGTAGAEAEILGIAAEDGRKTSSKGAADESGETEGEASGDILNWKLSSLDFESPQKLGSSVHVSSVAEVSESELGSGASNRLDFEILVPPNGKDESQHCIQSSHKGQASPIHDFRRHRVWFVDGVPETSHALNYHMSL